MHLVSINLGPSWATTWPRADSVLPCTWRGWSVVLRNSAAMRWSPVSVKDRWGTMLRRSLGTVGTVAGRRIKFEVAVIHMARWTALPTIFTVWSGKMENPHVLDGDVSVSFGHNSFCGSGDSVCGSFHSVRRLVNGFHDGVLCFYPGHQGSYHGNPCPCHGYHGCGYSNHSRS